MKKVKNSVAFPMSLHCRFSKDIPPHTSPIRYKQVITCPNILYPSAKSLGLGCLLTFGPFSCFKFFFRFYLLKSLPS